MSVVKLDILLVNVECAVEVAAAAVEVVDVVAVAAALQDIGEAQAMVEGELHVHIPIVPLHLYPVIL